MGKDMSEPLSIEDCINPTCPWSGKPVSADSLMFYRGHVIGFCNPGCRDKFQKASGLFDTIIDAGKIATRDGPPTIA
jgi:hypothetical protein